MSTYLFKQSFEIKGRDGLVRFFMWKIIYLNKFNLFSARKFYGYVYGILLWWTKFGSESAGQMLIL